MAEDSSLFVIPPMQYNGLICAAIVARLSPYQQAIVRCAGQLGAHSYQDAIESGHAVGAFIAEIHYMQTTWPPHLKSAPLVTPQSFAHIPLYEKITVVIDMRRLSRRDEGIVFQSAVQNPRYKPIKVYEMRIMHWSYPRSIMRLGRVIEASRLIIGPPAPRDYGCATHYAFPERLLSWGHSPHFTHLDVSGFATSMTRSPQQFLHRLWLPSTIDLSPLVNIRSIAPQFLSMCRFNAPFSTLDLNFMTKLENIDHRFMEMSSGVVCVDMSKLTRLKFVGSSFLCGSYDLEELKLPDGTTTKTQIYVSGSFLRGCKKLKRVNLQSLSNRKEIQSDFLYDCNSLRELDLAHFTSLTKIDSGFMTGCSAMQTINFSPTLQVSSLGDNFLGRNGCLRTIDLSFCSSITNIPAKFMIQCKLLQKTIDLTPLSNVVIISNCFLLDCCAMTHLDFSPMSKVENLGRQFLSGCTGLRDINFSGLGADNFPGSTAIHTTPDNNAEITVTKGENMKKFTVEPFFMGNTLNGVTLNVSLNITMPPRYNDCPTSPYGAISIAIMKTKAAEEDKRRAAEKHRMRYYS